MKNPTILKDELGILKADRSAVIMELRNLGEELKQIHEDIVKSEKVLADINDDILLQTARRDDIRSRAVSLEGKIQKGKQELNTISIRLETARNKNSQEEKLHLGRIKELSEMKESLLEDIETLKKTYDNNSTAMNINLSEVTARYKDLNTELEKATTELSETLKALKIAQDEEKKLTKERLKKEDKLRAREKSVARREQSVIKMEEDLKVMASDLTVLYFRFKEAYPDVDIDKLITKAV